MLYIEQRIRVMYAIYRTKDKGQKLKEVRQQQQFIQAVEDVEQWIREVELQLSSEDLGKDLTSVNNLLKKHMVCDYVCVLHVRVCICVSVSVCACVCLGGIERVVYVIIYFTHYIVAVRE